MVRRPSDGGTDRVIGKFHFQWATFGSIGIQILIRYKRFFAKEFCFSILFLSFCRATFLHLPLLNGPKKFFALNVLVLRGIHVDCWNWGSERPRVCPRDYPLCQLISALQDPQQSCFGRLYFVSYHYDSIVLGSGWRC